MSPWAFSNRQKLRRARAGEQRGAIAGYRAILHHFLILISIKRCRISGRACIQTSEFAVPIRSAISELPSIVGIS